jgi:hypothetical protein
MSYHSDISIVVYGGPDQNGWYGVQVDAFGGKQAGAAPIELQHQYGFASWPLDADVDADGNIAAGCQAVTMRSGRTDAFAILGHDSRYSDKCPPASKGSSAVWNARGDNFVLDYAEKRATLYVSTNDGTSAHAWTIGKDPNGDQVINIQHSKGGFLLFKGNKAQLRGNGNAYFEADGDKANINGNAKVLGSLGVGGAAGVIPAALATPLIGYLTALETLLGTVAGATVPTTAPAVAAFLGATAALKAAIASQFLTTA